MTAAASNGREVSVHVSDAGMRAGLPCSGPIPWKSISEKYVHASQRETTGQVQLLWTRCTE